MKKTNQDADIAEIEVQEHQERKGRRGKRRKEKEKKRPNHSQGVSTFQVIRNEKRLLARGEDGRTFAIPREFMIKNPGLSRRRKRKSGRNHFTRKKIFAPMTEEGPDWKKATIEGSTKNTALAPLG
jgi:hypothetical protein